GSKAITLYRPDGSIISSTVHASAGTLGGALAIPAAEAQDLLNGTRVVVRKASVEDLPFVETLGALAIRQKPVLVMGVGDLISLIEDRGAETRNLMIVTFTTVLVIILGFSLFLA